MPKLKHMFINESLSLYALQRILRLVRGIIIYRTSDFHSKIPELEQSCCCFDTDSLKVCSTGRIVTRRRIYVNESFTRSDCRVAERFQRKWCRLSNQ